MRRAAASMLVTGGALALVAALAVACGRTAGEDATSSDTGVEGGDDASPMPIPTATTTAPGFDAARPPPIDCPTDAVNGNACMMQGTLCTRPTGCCVCGGLAGVCAAVWVCSTPADNDPSCPSSEPADLGACSLDAGVSCSYCGTGAVPARSSCTSARIYQPCENAGHSSCWVSSTKGEHCD